MRALKKLETGVPGLDVLTMGGLPEGRSTLIAGKSGTGKTVIGLQIAFTPTLVRRAPGPRTFILGHITNPELVLELLADCEMERKN